MSLPRKGPRDICRLADVIMQILKTNNNEKAVEAIASLRADWVFRAPEIRGSRYDWIAFGHALSEHAPADILCQQIFNDEIQMESVTLKTKSA